MEKSLPWDGTTTGDAGGYSADQWDDVWEALFIGANAATSGVFPRVLNELAVTVTGPLEVTVASGAALVKGKYYRNSAPVTVAIGIRDDSVRYDRIVLQGSWSAQTIRIVKVPGTAGQPVTPLVQIDGSMWQLPLATITIPPTTLPGTPISVVYNRAYLRYSTRVQESMLDAATAAQLVTNGDAHDHVGGDGAALDITKLVAGAVTSVTHHQCDNSGNWASGGTNNYDMTGTKVKIQTGTIRLPTAMGVRQTSAVLTFPSAFHTGTTPLLILIPNIDYVANSPKIATYKPHATFPWESATIYVNEESDIGILEIDVQWLAIGEE